ncbi:hypothetical protein J3R30DRAFT_216254 [Lentinula aciculospora]|uniref:Galactose oxidase n=1 Tax=Lentinula aciculospora TaxID=153920 RepID=A0A9W9A921_9AGAR|nr:hypothetical protein J3R30DRAFT_216254 [Lentinula aciculospora]
MNFGLLQILVVVFAVVDLKAAAYTALPRWGQATAIINDALFVQGGRTDLYNTYSYTTAPIDDVLLYLSLSTSFDPSSPPWQLISSSSNSSTSSGPAVAWHTISATNTSEIFLFGGVPAINSPTVLTVQADSAWLLNVYNRIVPVWIQEAMSWANEPIRRIRHSASTSIDGVVFIVGGEKADDSGIAFSDHYVFDPALPSFTQLPSNNSPPGITGHASIILPNGTMLVFGGYEPSSSSMVNFSTIWTLDTTASSFEWIVLTAQGTIPGSRRAFAAVLIEGSKILIQGGSDSTFQTTYSDGWSLDLTSNPPVWSEVTTLSQVGQRRDHFAVSYGSDVIFGFGYGASAPASTPLIIYDPSGGSGQGSFPSTYSAPSPTSVSFTQTIPGVTPTITGTDSPGTQTGTGFSGSQPTSTSNPNNPGNGSPGNNNSGSNEKTEGIAIGTALGVLALLVAGVIVVYYMRRRRFNAAEESRFMLLNENDPEAGLPSVRSSGEKGPYSERWNVLKNLKIGGALTAVPGGVVGLSETRPTAARRDMLADEDTRDFGPWYGRRKRDGTGDSSWSLRSFMKIRGREGSTSSYTSLATPFREKSDPFSDGAALMGDEETGFVGAAVRGHGGSSSRPSHIRDMSYASTSSAASDHNMDLTPYSSGLIYHDPFSDPFGDDKAITEPPAASTSFKRANPRPSQSLQIQTMLPIEVHSLSPVTEASRATLSQSDHTSSISSQSHEHNISPFNTISHVTSRTSFSPRPSSLLDANILKSDSQSIRRSNSWWSRFSHTSLLDRRGSGSKQLGGMPDIRDPNPPPRLGGLVAIEESQHSGSPEHDSPNSNRSNSLNSIKRALSRSNGSKVYKGKHGKSLSSLRTADSEAIERMAGAVDVVQRERTGSHGTRDSTSSYDSNSPGWLPEDGRGLVHGVDMSSFDVASPVDMSLGESIVSPEYLLTTPQASPSKAVSPEITPPISDPNDEAISNRLTGSGGGLVRAPTKSTVATRIREYERRMSQAQSIPDPTNTRKHEERSDKRKPLVNYGLTTRPSLFVANPDHRQGFSQDSQT